MASEHGEFSGFWLGLWQGFIAPFVFVASLFKGTLTFYEVHNLDARYNFGYLFGLRSCDSPVRLDRMNAQHQFELQKPNEQEKNRAELANDDNVTTNKAGGRGLALNARHYVITRTLQERRAEVHGFDARSHIRMMPMVPSAPSTAPATT
jgi:hypothetical protein